MVDAVCDKLTHILRTNLKDIDDKKAEIINFGIKSIVSEFSKTTVLLAAAYALGVLNYIIIAIVSFGTYRIFAGGFHAKSHIGCLTTNSIMLFSIVYSSFFINTYLNYICFLIFLINCIIIYLYAPADVEEKPVVSKKLRRKLKYQSFIVMSMIFIVSLIMVDRVIANILILSTFFESLTLLPISYRLMKCRHGYGEAI